MSAASLTRQAALSFAWWPEHGSPALWGDSAAISATEGLASGSSTHGEGLVKKLDMVAGALPVVTDGRPPDRWTLGELLADTARLGLLSVRQVVLHLLDRQEVQPWETRRLADAGMAVVRLLANVQRDAMRQQADDARWTTTYTQRLAEFEREL